MATTIMFYVIAAIILICSLLAVQTKYIIRSATYLIGVLFGAAALYFLMGYTFLGAVQMMIYAGGVVVLYIFGIMLTGRGSDTETPARLGKKIAALVASLAGAAVLLFLVLSHSFAYKVLDAPSEQGPDAITVTQLGEQLIASDKGGYLLPFEAVSVLLLACIIGSLIIARKR